MTSKKKRPGRPRLYKNDAERKRAWYIKQRLKQNAVPKLALSPAQEEEEFQPELIDTLQWSWEKWALYFLGIQLQWFQILCLTYLAMFLRLILNLPRRHGKTTIILRTFVTRKLCETAITKKDINFAYISANKDNVIDYILMIAGDLMDNERIIENYGYLLDPTSIKEVRIVRKTKRKNRRQTQMVLNLGNRIDIFNHSLFGTTVRGGIRGKGYDRCFIDDPYELFDKDTPAPSRKFTKKLMTFIKEKIYPLAEQNISLIGTREDLDGYDIYSQLAAEFEGRIWKLVKYKAINVFGKYRIADLKEDEKINPSHIIIDKPDEWELLSEFIWDRRAEKYLAMTPPIKCSGLQYAAYMFASMEARYFQKEYQNNPIAISSDIKWEWFQPYEELPPLRHITFAIFADIASGLGDEADRTAIVLMGKLKTRTAKYFWHKQLTGKWPAHEKYAKIEKFVRDCEDELDRRIPLLVEVVKNQREAYQYLKHKCQDLKVRQVNPKDRGDKVWRISNGIVLSAADGELWINKFIAQKKELKDEVEGFPLIHPDLLDAGDQVKYFLSKKTKGIWKA